MVDLSRTATTSRGFLAHGRSVHGQKRPVGVENTEVPNGLNPVFPITETLRVGKIPDDAGMFGETRVSLSPFLSENCCVSFVIFCSQHRRELHREEGQPSAAVVDYGSIN